MSARTDFPRASSLSSCLKIPRLGKRFPPSFKDLQGERHCNSSHPKNSRHVRVTYGVWHQTQSYRDDLQGSHAGYTVIGYLHMHSAGEAMIVGPALEFKLEINCALMSPSLAQACSPNQWGGHLSR